MSHAPNFAGPTGSPATQRGRVHPLFNSPVRFEAAPRPDDDEQATAQTIARMVELSRADAIAPEIRAAALEAAGSNPDPHAQAVAVWAWIRCRVRFISDAALAGPVSPTAAEDEVLIRPVDLLRMPQPAGDCDDYSMLAAAMLRSLGIRHQFVTVAADAADPSRYSHVYVAAYVPDRLALDCSHGPHPGWEAPRQGKRREWSTDPMQSQLHGLRAIDWNQLIQTGTSTAGKILTARYGVAPTGTYQQGADGSVFYRQPAGSGGFSFPTTQIGGGTSTMLLIGGVVVVLFMFMSMNSRNR